MKTAEPDGVQRVVVLGASAGGVEALSALVRVLPESYPLPVLVVLHVPPTSSFLPEILSRAGHLPAGHASDMEPLVGGRIYVAPPDCHLLVEDTMLRLVRGPKENAHRPAIDPLFRTAAAAHGPGVVAVVLSGSLDDGTAGLAAVKELGGTTIVQDPAEALYSAMPSSALAVEPDYVLPLADIADLLVRIAGGSSASDPAKSTQEQEGMEADPTQLNPEAVAEANREVGELTPFTCPECNGSLWEVREGGLVKLRCRVGHAYTEEAYAHQKAVALEAALWTGLTALVERAEFSRRLSERFRHAGQNKSAIRYEDQADRLLGEAETVRRALVSLDTPHHTVEQQAS